MLSKLIYSKVDIGASDTRYLVGREIHVMPNNMYLADQVENFSRLEVDTEDFNSCLEVNIKKTYDVTGKYPLRALIGSLAKRKASSTRTPVGNRLKLDQDVNIISILTATAHTVMELHQEDTVPDVALVLALPPSEVSNDATQEKLNNLLLGEFTVDFPKLDRVVKFNVTVIKPFEESRLALMAFIRSPEPAATQFFIDYASNGVVLSVDIGASTTDVAIFDRGAYIDISAKTFPFGGNNGINRFRELFEASKDGFKIRDVEAKEAYETGRLRSGNDWLDVSYHVNKAKQEIANKIIGGLDNYFADGQYTEQSIRAICVSGGGSLESSYMNDRDEKVITTPALSHFITTHIKYVSSKVHVKQYDGNSRHANVAGLCICADLLEMKRIKDSKK